MPIYEYRCTTCDERFEVLMSAAERAPAHCPHCGASRVERLLSTFAVGNTGATDAARGPCGTRDCACRARDA